MRSYYSPSEVESTKHTMQTINYVIDLVSKQNTSNTRIKEKFRLVFDVNDVKEKNRLSKSIKVIFVRLAITGVDNRR